MDDHIGPRVNDVEAARRFYKASLQALGLVDEHAKGAAHVVPGLRPYYSPCYFGAFLAGPDGDNGEARLRREGK